MVTLKYFKIIKSIFNGEKEFTDQFDLNVKMFFDVRRIQSKAFTLSSQDQKHLRKFIAYGGTVGHTINVMELDGTQQLEQSKLRHGWEMKNNYKIKKFMEKVLEQRGGHRIEYDELFNDIQSGKYHISNQRANKMLKMINSIPDNMKVDLSEEYKIVSRIMIQYNQFSGNFPLLQHFLQKTKVRVFQYNYQPKMHGGFAVEMNLISIFLLFCDMESYI